MLRTFLRRLLSKGTDMLNVGDKAPDFEARDHSDQPVRLADLAGKRFILWFYPKADTPG